MVSATQISPGDHSSTRQHSSPAGIAIVGVLVLALFAFAGYKIGREDGSRVTALEGNAYVGAHQASVKADGWVYGIADGVAWVDSAGGFHESGWPTCLGSIGTTVRIRFGEFPVTGPDGSASREVAWVDCRGSVVVS
jgi:hypothetical protein